jgi:DegV family protein with EDD domain
MIGKIAVVTDSAAYLPREVIEKYGVLVAPLSVEIDGHLYLEGIDITPDEFYGRLASATTVTTSQPSIGRLLECYRQAAQQGAEEILSIHIGAGVSGTVQSALLAAESSPVPVRVVDTGQASFAEGLCVWEAIEALADGASAQEAKERALAASSLMGNTFVVKALDLVKRGGRLISEGGTQAAGVPVMALTPRGIEVVQVAKTLEEAVEAMTARVVEGVERAGGRRLRVGVGHAAAPEIAHALRRRIERLTGVREVIDYVVGPAVGAHTGAGSAGAVFVPRPVIL